MEVSYPRARTMTRFRDLMGFNSILPELVWDYKTLKGFVVVDSPSNEVLHIYTFYGILYMFC